MPCDPLGAGFFPAPPPLPPGMSVPLFPGLTIPSEGLCCKIQVPPWGPLPVPMVTLGIAFPQVAVTAYASFIKGLQAAYDAVPIPCPNE